MITCDVCQREFKNQQGLTGHMRFVHGIKPNKQHPLFPTNRFITDDNFAEVMMKVLDTPAGDKFIMAVAKELCERSGK
jgi:hypothetical protein